MKTKRKTVMFLFIFIMLFVCIYLFFIKRDTYVIDILNPINSSAVKVNLQDETEKIIKNYGLENSIIDSQIDKIFISMTPFEKLRLSNSDNFASYGLSFIKFSDLIEKGYVPIGEEEEYLKR